MESHHTIPLPEFLRKKEEWRDLNSLIMVESIRELNDQDSTERRYNIFQFDAQCPIVGRDGEHDLRARR